MGVTTLPPPPPGQSALMREPYTNTNARQRLQHLAAHRAVNAYRKSTIKFPLWASKITVESLSLFIAHLSINSSKHNNYKIYKSKVSQQTRLQYGINLANHFVIKKLLKAVRKQTKPDTRLPVTAAIPAGQGG